MLGISKRYELQTWLQWNTNTYAILKSVISSDLELAK